MTRKASLGWWGLRVSAYSPTSCRRKPWPPPDVDGPSYDLQSAVELLAQAGFVDSDGDEYVAKYGQALETGIGG